MRRRAALCALALGLGPLVLSARLAGQVIASDRAALVAEGTSTPAATLTGWRVDPVRGHTELSIAAPGAAFRVSPPVVRDGRLRVVVELPGTRLGALEGPSLPDDNGGILAVRAEEDGSGAVLTVDLVSQARFQALPGEGGLLLIVQGGGAPAASWVVATAGQEPPRVLPGAPRGSTAAIVGHASAASAPRTAASGPAPARRTGTMPAQDRAVAQATMLPAAPVRWRVPHGGPVSASWTLLLMAFALGTPFLAARLSRRRVQKQMPAAHLHTVFPDGSRRRHAAPWLAATSPVAAPVRAAPPRPRPPSRPVARG